jgi:hypothetical protein
MSLHVMSERLNVHFRPSHRIRIITERDVKNFHKELKVDKKGRGRLGRTGHSGS